MKDTKQWGAQGGLDISREIVGKSYSKSCQGFTVDFHVPGLPVIHFGAVVCLILHDLFSCQVVTIPALVEVGNLKPTPH